MKTIYLKNIKLKNVSFKNFLFKSFNFKSFNFKIFNYKKLNIENVNIKNRSIKKGNLYNIFSKRFNLDIVKTDIVKTKIAKIDIAKTLIFCLLFIIIPKTWAAKLAIVIDDFGYRQHNEEQIIALSPNITIAVLPHAPNAVKMANLAHKHGNDILIHLPMAPISKQPLEVNTLFPSMSENQIDEIISEAVERVPYAVGMNNHMGSLMTTDLTAMTYVMRALSRYDLFFLDSKTVSGTQAKPAAEMYHIPLVTRDVFLDNQQIESEINRQFDLAINLARKQGSAIAIGHPHSETIKLLKKKLANLPDDIELVKVQQLTRPRVEQ